MSNFNDQVIADFIANGGQPGGYFEGKPVLLLHAIGAKSGVERTQPLMYLRENDTGPWYVFASYGGAPNNPAWYHNVLAHPDFDISVGDGKTISRLPVRASVVEGEDRDTIYARMASLFPQFADYEKKTTREAIPVIALTPRAA
ncbi:nitroreductase/quinone reductase family protein [Devosia sp. 63-57]|uniref:nitroreductase/quinone reductase family protein n=1 Tax=Devosia sp. 63-57 TaxID=1895751 RepID=UPI00086E9CD5|nr:nitroreductase/quinone reductase family protein [Devosia sp. 63-57]ODT51207.1 MAG: hypothetical protein ABS74_00550 [Pelagibacterium sp. SCN 63-126]ODU84163.1 MAG: hypothetical protein ABT14_15035 [Pelagibacterium sp. SCN 63-17]OJX41671.1 MAG: hypothetical protein BGO80_08685 [Devosia sp. 63-57]